MKLMTKNYTIEYIDSYVDGVKVNWFKVTIGRVVIDVEYSQESKDIMSRGIDTGYRVSESNDRDGEDVSYVYEENEALTLFEYAKYEIKKVCDFMLELV